MTKATTPRKRKTQSKPRTKTADKPLKAPLATTPRKSELQVRAEKCAERFRANSRRPVVIELAGLPKAGKTTTLSQVQSFLKRCGFRVEVVIERASVCPIRDKKHANFNVWTACTTLSQILQQTQTPPRPEDPDILILDRGLFDSVCWLSTMERLSRIRKKERMVIENFLLLEDWCSRIQGIIMMTANPKDALGREKGYLPVVNVSGSIMNEKVLESMASVLDEVQERVGHHFSIYKINTSSSEFNSPEKSCAAAASRVLDWIEGDLEEQILSLPQNTVAEIFDSRPCVSAATAQILMERFQADGEYSPRELVESNLSRVQALPIVVVRNKNGEILRLRRKEKTANSLHKRIVIWAGGHVRSEDSESGAPIIHCAAREVEEELRLCVEPNKACSAGVRVARKN